MTLMMTPMQIAAAEPARAANPSKAAPKTGARERFGLETLGRGVMLYIAIGLVIIQVAGYDLLGFFLSVPRAFVNFVSLAKLLVPWWAGVALIGVLLGVTPIRRRLVQRAAPVLIAVMLCGAFTMMFGLIKNELPALVPFWADDLFTRADLALHFGHAPHDLLAFMAPLDTNSLLTFYFNGWVFFATFFPVLLIAFDDNAARRRVFLILWMGCWIGLGNVLAAAFMSYGPIFADLFDQGLAPYHQGALALFDRADAAGLMGVKMRLWHAYTGESGMLGSGISAFPSVHVGMATLFGLYVARLGADFARAGLGPLRLRQAVIWLTRLAAVAYVVTYAVLSVWLGWHYALDGYVSIALMSAAYLLLSKRLAAPAA